MKSSELTEQDVQRFILPNGLTVLIQPLYHLASVSVGLSVSVGSRDEEVPEAGMSHFVEHMLFQGTRQRDTRELSRVISAVGGTLDACTGRESTAFYAKVPARHTALAMDVISDMLQNARLQEALIQKEKQIILEEIRMYEDAPDEIVHDLLFKAFWPKHALGRPILGTRKSLESFTRRDVLAFMQQHYCADRMILAVAGNIEPQRVLRLAKRYFSQLPCSKPDVRRPQPIPAQSFEQRIKTRHLEQVHVCLGVNTMPFTDKRRLSALALSNILGAAANSRLFYEVREKRALVYTIYSFMDFYRDTGIGGIYFACQPTKVLATLKIVFAELDRLASRKISVQELHDVREQMAGNYLISLESSSTHMWNLIQQEMYLKKHPKPKAVLHAIGKIQREDIQAVANTFFKDVPLAASLVGAVPPIALKRLKKTKTLK